MHTQTHKVTYATDHLTHTLATAGVDNNLGPVFPQQINLPLIQYG